MTGTLFANMFVLDRMALFFKMFIVGATILVILASIDYIHRFKFFRGEYYFLVVMSALGMMFMASANDLLSVFVTSGIFDFRLLCPGGLPARGYGHQTKPESNFSSWASSPQASWPMASAWSMEKQASWSFPI